MDALLAFLGIVVICLACSVCTVCALWLHHVREMGALRIREFEVQQMALISDRMLEKNMLPPMARRL